MEFFYQWMAEKLYVYREKIGFALDLCIVYCKKDIELYLYHKKSFEGIGGLKPSCSIKRLAIIYEKIGKYDEAILLCRFAISQNLCDGTKGGFQGRMEKLQRKKPISKVD